MKNVMFFIYSFHVFTLAYKQEKHKIICNMSDKNDEHFLFMSI